MTAPCPRGPRYPSRTRAKAARLQTVRPENVRVVQCAACGGIHLMPKHLTNRDTETRNA